MAIYENIESVNEVTLDEITTPSTPDADKIKVYPVDVAGLPRMAHLTPDGIQDIRLPDFTAGNSDTGLAQLVPTGDPSLVATIGYRVMATFLESGEDKLSNVAINYEDTGGSSQSTFLVEADDKFLFPSNINSFGIQYVPYFIRTVMVIDLSAVNNATTKFYIRLRREVDDSFVATDGFIQSDFNAQTGLVVTSEIKTFVNSETDPFVVDGTYIDILNDSNSAGTVTLQDVSVRIFRG